MTLLKINKLTKSFGGLTAVANVNMEINKGELVGLIGPNGAGKTTVFNLLTGVYRPTHGTITLADGSQEIALEGLKPHKICSKGLARTFQNIRLFKELTVLDNVRIAMHKNVAYGLLSGFLHLPSFKREEDRLVEESLRLLEIFDLADKKDELAKNLPYGEQRHLEIARALATKPKLLLLDEPAAGMNPAETDELMETITLIRKKYDVTILLIEHDMKLVAGICEKIFVLNFGTELANGLPQDVLNNPEVIKAYLGE